MNSVMYYHNIKSFMLMLIVVINGNRSMFVQCLYHRYKSVSHRDE